MKAHSVVSLLLAVLAACNGGTTGQPDPAAVDAAVEQQPFIVASGLNAPGHIAVDSEHIYVTERDGGGGPTGDRIVELARADGARGREVASDQRMVAGFALTPDSLFWIVSGTHAADFIDGAVARFDRVAGETAVIATNRPLPAGIAAYDAFVYWAEIDGGRIARAPADGAGEAEDLYWSQNSKTSIAVTAAEIFWTAGGPDEDVVAMNKASGARTVISTEEYSPDSLVARGSDLYWIEQGAPGGVDRSLRVSREGGPPTDLVATERLARQLRLGGDALYWISEDGIRRLRPGDEEPQTLFEREIVGSIALFGGLLYFTDPVAGLVLAFPVE